MKVRCSICGDYINVPPLLKCDVYFCAKSECQKFRRKRTMQGKYQVKNKEYKTHTDEPIFSDKLCLKCREPVECAGTIDAVIYYRFCASCRTQITRRANRLGFDPA